MEEQGYNNEQDLEQFISNKWTVLEFLVFSLGFHSNRRLEGDDKAGNFLQDFIVYMLIGIPICYMQLILGQYTGSGIFFLRRMVPIAQGIGYVYVLTVFGISIMTVIQMETCLIYGFLSINPQPLNWLTCPKKYAHICWNITDDCEKCVNETVHMSTTIYWNYTYMKTVASIENASIGLPDINRLWGTILCWIAIYIITLTKVVNTKKLMKIIISTSIVIRIIIALKLLSYQDSDFLMQKIFSFYIIKFSDLQTWREAIYRMLRGMSMGDFTYIMFGIFVHFSTNTGALTILSGTSTFLLVFVENLAISAAAKVLAVRAATDPKDLFYFYRPFSIPLAFTVVPQALGFMSFRHIWAFIYFANHMLLSMVVTSGNLIFVHISLYQRFKGMQSYYKYTCPLFCLVGFAIQCFLSSKNIYEITMDIASVMLEFCYHINTLLLALMVFYAYGIRQFSEDIHFMTGSSPSKYWKLIWTVVPVVLLISVPYEFLSPSHIFFKIRITIIALIFSPLFVLGIRFTIMKIYQRDMLNLFKSDPSWGPEKTSTRNERNEFHPLRETKYRKYNYKCPHECLIRLNTLQRTQRNELAFERGSNEAKVSHTRAPPTFNDELA